MAVDDGQRWDPHTANRIASRFKVVLFPGGQGVGFVIDAKFEAGNGRLRTTLRLSLRRYVLYCRRAMQFHVMSQAMGGPGSTDNLHLPHLWLLYSNVSYLNKSLKEANICLSNQLNNVTQNNIRESILMILRHIMSELTQIVVTNLVPLSTCIFGMLFFGTYSSWLQGAKTKVPHVHLNLDLPGTLRVSPGTACILVDKIKYFAVFWL